MISSHINAQEYEWQWADQVIGNYIQSNSVTVDSQGNSIIAGVFVGTSVFGDIQLHDNNNNGKLFIAKKNSNGEWLWVRQSGGTGSAKVYSITTDADDNIYVTGTFTGTISLGGGEMESVGAVDLFVAKLNSDGLWQWARRAGGQRINRSSAIAIDNEGNIFITGFFSEAGQFGATRLVAARRDIFVAKLNNHGTWMWAIRAGGEAYSDWGRGVSVDNEGNAYVTGTINGPADFGNFIVDPGFATRGVFVAKLNSEGEWQWVATAGSQSQDYVYDIVVDNQGNIYTAGIFFEYCYFGDIYIEGPVAMGTHNVYVAKLNNDGEWLWVRRAAGLRYRFNDCQSISIDNSGDLYITGYFNISADFGRFTLFSQGDRDIFIAKLSSEGEWLWAKRAGGPQRNTVVSKIAVDNAYNVYITGNLIGTTNFDHLELEQDRDGDIFVAKLGAIPPLPPQVGIEIIDIDGTKHTRIYWREVPNARSYIVFASDNPYTEDWGDPIAIVTSTSYTEVIAQPAGKYFYVVASLNEPPDD